jgi:hypothetical protein
MSSKVKMIANHTRRHNSTQHDEFAKSIENINNNPQKQKQKKPSNSSSYNKGSTLQMTSIRMINIQQHPKLETKNQATLCCCIMALPFK